MRALAGLLILLGALILAGPVKAAAIEDWFDNEGQATLQSYAPSVFPDLSEEQLSELTMGLEQPEISFDERSSDPRLSEGDPDGYAAPIVLDEDIIGVMTYEVVAEGETEAEVHADAYFGQQIAAMRDTDLLIRDPELEAHYIIRDDQVIPVSAAALDQLAGSTTVESFLELRDSRLADSQTTQEAAQPSDSTPVVFAISLLALFLIGTALTIWLRRSPNAPQPPEIILRTTRQVRVYRRGGNRVNADD